MHLFHNIVFGLETATATAFLKFPIYFSINIHLKVYYTILYTAATVLQPKKSYPKIQVQLFSSNSFVFVLVMLTHE